jgi:radical SAM superfamily enzyme YgiQ (UPF0313 family)
VLYEDNFNYLSKMCLLRMREAALAMVGMAREQGCAVAVAGSDASDHPEIYLDAGADFVILGEGELTLAQLAGHLLGGSSDGGDREAGLAAIDGLARRDPAGAGVVRQRARAPIRDLDALPLPAWDLVDFERYRRAWTGRHGRFSLNVVTSRGCPYHCNWCAKPIWGQGYNARSPESVVDEMAWLRELAAPDDLWFMDDILGLERSWWPRFADALEERGLRIPFKCLSRPDLVLRAGQVDAMRRAGCRVVWIGAESGSQRVLDAMEKGTRVEQIQAAAERLHAAGIEVGFFLQFGYPGETRDDIESTLQMVRDCRPDDVGVSVSYPLPGTPFYERVREQLGAQRQWRDSNDLAMLYRGPFSTAFYRKLHRVLHRELRARRAGRDLAGALRDPRRLRPAHVARGAGALWRWASLPVERAHLGLLARRAHRGVAALGPVLSNREAATPSPASDGAPPSP